MDFQNYNFDKKKITMLKMCIHKTIGASQFINVEVNRKNRSITGKKTTMLKISIHRKTICASQFMNDVLNRNKKIMENLP